MSAQMQCTEYFSMRRMPVNVPAYRGVKHTGAIAVVGDTDVVGYTNSNVVAGDAARLNRGPTVMVEAGAIIDGTDPVLKFDAQGRVVPGGVAADKVGYLMTGQTAGAVGAIVEIIPIYR